MEQFVVGYKLAGIAGVLVSIIGTVIPPFVIYSVTFLSVIMRFRTNELVSQMLEGMQAGVGAVIASVTYEMGADVVKEKDGISLLIILLIPAGIYFTIRTRGLPIRLFPDMVVALTGKKDDNNSLSTFQTLIVSTATRVGMGNLVGVVAAVSAGGAGAVFWMWVTALIGSSTAFIEATLAQMHKERDPLYGGFRGGPAYYIHDYIEGRTGKKKNHVLVSVLFAVSGLICWCGISQVISNSVAASFENAFSIPPLYTTIVLVILAAVIVLRKNATVKVLDLMVPLWRYVISYYNLHHRNEYRKSSWSICKDYPGGIRSPSGSSGWIRSSVDEWSKARTVFK